MKDKTAIYHITKKMIEDEYELLRCNKITPWAFLHSGHPFRCTDFYGKEISYSGIRFEGTPEQVFWTRFIEPFLEDIILRSLDKTVLLCRGKKINLNEPIAEVGNILKVIVHNVYENMADVDQRLRGNGYPDNVKKKDVTSKIASLSKLIDERIKSELAIWEKPSALTDFYHNHPFLFWLISALIGISGLIIKFLI